MSKYLHTTEFHNLKAPNEIVPIIMQWINPQSVIDIGCGLGTFLKVFKENGVKSIVGIDGHWCKKDLLFKNIKPEEFIEADMEKVIVIDQRFDLAICLEVAEHLSSQRADSFVEDLARLSDVILFSAAIPNQGGDHHYNEQWLSYWEDKFEKNGYRVYDVLKPVFWNNKNVFWWYKQNMVLIVKSTLNLPFLNELEKNVLENPIHPELYLTITDYRDKNAIKRYLRALYKALIFRIGLTK